MALIAFEYTLVGMGVVFSVLLFLILIISLLKYLPGASGKKKPTGSAELPTDLSEKLTAVQQKEASADHLERIAVISAAIAAFMASEGVDSDGYVVRKITRR